MSVNDILGAIVLLLSRISSDFLPTLKDLLEKLSGDSGLMWWEELKKFVCKKPCWLPTPILKRLRTISLPAIARFDGSTLQTGTVDGVKIWVSEKFEEIFGGKVENNLPATKLVAHELTQSSRNLAIITAIGGDDAAEVSLGHLWELIKRQPRGENGALIANSWANVFYVRDSENNLWAVCVCWRDGEWRFYASSLESRGGWRAGNQVFSREVS